MIKTGIYKQITAIGKDAYFYKLGHAILAYNKSVYSTIPTKSKDLKPDVYIEYPCSVIKDPVLGYNKSVYSTIPTKSKDLKPDVYIEYPCSIIKDPV